jgi:1-acyl-sn-glycerol-3-phosphate acyltransferase
VATFFLLGTFAGLIGLPLLLDFLGPAPSERHRPGGCLTVGLLALVIPLLPVIPPCTSRISIEQNFLRYLFAHCSLLLALWSWLFFYPQAVELLCEMLLAPMYRVRARGPGRDAIPRQGPLLLVANHSSYFDPFWVGLVVPRRVRPMMTSRFFDLPGIRWLMETVVQAVRVQVTRVRREVPELQEAVAVLRQGGCLLIFPEGRLRREAGQMLQPFGQGVWHLLKELPQTPVVVMWMEGGWGSYLSYDEGPPGRNKRPDWGRRIDVALAAPRVLPAEVLADQRGTRRFLERACLECRAYLGLPVP